MLKYPLSYFRYMYAAQPSDVSFSAAQDQALVKYVDSLSRHLSVTASSLQPWDIHLSEAQKSSQEIASLQGELAKYLDLHSPFTKNLSLIFVLFLPSQDLFCWILESASPN